MLSELTGNSLSPQRAPAKAGELRRSALDAGKAKEVLGWGAEVNLKQGLEKTVDWFRSELDV
jgi:UDP-glucose 4-epimerase